MNIRRIEESDHNDSAEVVSHCKCCEEDLKTHRNSFAEHRKHPERECDVSRHRDRDTTLHSRICRAEKHKHEYGNNHSTARSDDREHSLFSCRQLPDKDLALDLKTYREEEDRHKEIVDNLHYGHSVTIVAEEVEVTDGQAYRMLPQ